MDRILRRKPRTLDEFNEAWFGHRQTSFAYYDGQHYIMLSMEFYNTGGWTFIPTWRIWARPLIWDDADDANGLESKLIRWKEDMYFAKDLDHNGKLSSQ